MATPFGTLAPTPTEHFRLYIYAAIQQVIHQLDSALESADETARQFPFLGGYREALDAYRLPDLSGRNWTEWWSRTLDALEARAQTPLPLRRLRRATGFDHAAILFLMTAGLLEEDARFGAIFEAMQGLPGQRRATLGLLTAWWRGATTEDPRATLRRAVELGLVDVPNVDSPRLEWTLHIPAPVWDAFRGDPHPRPAPGLRFVPRFELTPLGDVILSSDLQDVVQRIPGMLNRGAIQAVIVRGPRHNGRKTLLRGLAHATDLGTLEVDWPRGSEHWTQVGPLATLLGAMPIVELDVAPGDTLQVPALSAYDGPLGIALGRQGGVSGEDMQRAVALDVPLPEADTRRRLWVAGSVSPAADSLECVTGSFRLTAGNIRRAAALAGVEALLHGRTSLIQSDVKHASRLLNREALDALAQRLVCTGNWTDLAVGDQTWVELQGLESRCRQRERLGQTVGETLGAQLNAGVRALFVGPSGTGKSLAARLLAGALGRDIYRLDLSAVVNKYIGETEKNLERVFARAEELDVILLLDEGDALLTARTSVQTANDRYANLETNYLLQRLESFEGIVIITTNASEHIDAAFQRRMDVVVTFPPPGPMERWAIWRTHLPANNTVDLELLEDVARRCELRGGQIRNAVVYASLLALEDGGVVCSTHLASAVRREYRRVNAVCPLRTHGTAA